MEILDFKNVVSNFESQLKTEFEFEVQEKNYSAYSFGSGLAAYKIKGKMFRLIFDGKDNIVALEKSDSHQSYPNCTWESLFYAKPKEFLEKATAEIKAICK